MFDEITWLALTLAVTASLSFPYVLDRIAVRGLLGTMANPLPTDLPQSAWAQRAQRAHANAVENLVLFAPAAIAVHALAVGDGLTRLGCAIYFGSRLVHYAVYVAGIPVARTLAFFGGWAGIMILVGRLLRLW
jgi:uncharacterized MAPEG superfamily protein